MSKHTNKHDGRAVLFAIAELLVYLVNTFCDTVSQKAERRRSVNKIRIREPSVPGVRHREIAILNKQSYITGAETLIMPEYHSQDCC